MDKNQIQEAVKESRALSINEFAESGKALQEAGYSEWLVMLLANDMKKRIQEYGNNFAQMCLSKAAKGKGDLSVYLISISSTLSYLLN